MSSLRARTYTSAFSATVLSLVFAALWVGAHSFELWSSSLKVKPGHEAPVTVRLPSSYFRITMLRNEYHYLATSSSACPRLVPRGTKLQAGKECTGLVKAYESARRPIRPASLLGYFAMYFVIGLLLSLYMRKEGMGRARWLRSQVTVFLTMTVMVLGSKAILLFTALPAQILPVTMVPLLAAYFLGRRVSFVVAFTSALLAASMLGFDVEVMLMHLITGVASVVVLGPRKRASMMLKAGAMAAWVAVVATVVTTLLFSGTLDIHDDITEHVDPRYSLWLSALFSGIGSGILAWILAPLIGVLVGEVSRGRLLDLQDLDHPLLTKLRERAPSTWEHSRAMANLAEAAAHAIGGNALLVRVGAYYHDVGKSLKPEYFIENQGGGENPHDKLGPHDSARAIFQHVIEGTRLLRQEGVPEDVIEFAFTHHGTSVLEFFWHKNLAAGNSAELTEKDFSYPGHKPVTKETGILMVVDAIEAAARTVDQPDKSHFEQLVQRIIFTKLSQGQLDETGLMVVDVRVIANTIVDTLVSMYHARIKYPWQTESSATTSTGSEESSPSVAPPPPTPVPQPEDEAVLVPEPKPQSGSMPTVQDGEPDQAGTPDPTPAPAPDPTPAPVPAPARITSTDPAKPASSDSPTTYTGPAPTPPPVTKPGNGSE